ncbi:hypothetical protein ACKVMT_07020 [Halobacteriales archaeon Cl-PHB]
MALAQLLEALGLGGSLVLVISGVLAVYHIREIMQAVGRLQTWVMAIAVFGLVLILGAAGYVPGLSPNLHTLAGFILNGISVTVETVWQALTGWFL